MAQQLISKEQLFAGTLFAPNMQDAIYKDILSLRKYFPDVYPYPFRYPQYLTILLQGPVPIRIGQNQVALPLSMALPLNFPFSPPITQIAVARGFPLIPSPALRADGVINTQYFFQWIPRQSRLYNFVYSISQYFTINPPFSYQDGLELTPNHYSSNQPSPASQAPQSNDSELPFLIDEATVEAISIIENANSEIYEAESQYAESLLECNLSETIQNVYNDMKQIVETNQSELNKLKSEPLPKVEISSETEDMVKRQSKADCYEDVKAELKVWYEEGIISLDDFLKAIREISREHFMLIVE